MFMFGKLTSSVLLMLRHGIVNESLRVMDIVTMVNYLHTFSRSHDVHKSIIPVSKNAISYEGLLRGTITRDYSAQHFLNTFWKRINSFATDNTL